MEEGREEESKQQNNNKTEFLLMQEFLPLGHKFSMGVTLAPSGQTLALGSEKNLTLCMYKSIDISTIPKQIGEELGGKNV